MDDSRPTWPGTPPGHSSSAPSGKRALALYLDGEEIALTEGELILGRSPSCDIVIDDMLASRVHAKLTVSEGAVILRDLGSANGVWVNSARIDMPTPLRDGDRLLIGTKELSVFAVRVEGSGVGGRSSDEPPTRRVSSVRPAVTSNRTSSRVAKPAGPSAPSAPSSTSTPGMRAQRIQEASRSMPHTEKTDAFSQLGLLAKRMIDTGRVDGAIRVLAEHMRNVIEGARDGRPVPEDVLVSASDFAMTFAAAKLDAKWVDYVVELHLNVRRPMSAGLIDQLCSLRRKNVRCNRDTMLFYKAALQREEPSLPLSQRVLVARILSLTDD